VIMLVIAVAVVLTASLLVRTRARER
jgi:hypothetical protein